MENQCFYLSLARSYIGPCRSQLLQQTALNFKRVIEDAVCREHPEWQGTDKIGEDMAAFADFINYHYATKGG